MVKVVKPGRKQMGWSKEFKCTGAGNGGGGCGAILLVSEYDLYETTSYSGGGSGGGEKEYHPTFCCPKCGVETDLKFYEDIPSIVSLKGKRPSPVKRKNIGIKNVSR